MTAKTEDVFQARGPIRLAETEGCTIWQFRNETGDGTMAAYEVFPGAMVSFNDFHMARYDSGYVADRELLAIDHCREGRMEYQAGENAVAYTEAGDVKLDRRKLHTGLFEFPSSHYHGLTVVFDLEIIKNSLPAEIRNFPVTPENIISRWELGRYPRVLHGAERMEHIFGEMYQVPEKIRLPYLKIKILELLLYLDAVNIPEKETERPYFYRTQVEKVKAVRQFLMDHMEENFTQEELSRRFDFPLTPMKNCFRSAYGSSIGAWLTTYRMNQAAELLLKDRERTISEIGCQVGYDSASKFAMAFKKVMKLSPSEYRMERGKKNGNE